MIRQSILVSGPVVQLRVLVYDFVGTAGLLSFACRCKRCPQFDLVAHNSGADGFVRDALEPADTFPGKGIPARVGSIWATLSLLK